jgi:hypothetical protein
VNLQLETKTGEYQKLLLEFNNLKTEKEENQVEKEKEEFPIDENTMNLLAERQSRIEELEAEKDILLQEKAEISLQVDTLTEKVNQMTSE